MAKIYLIQLSFILVVASFSVIADEMPELTLQCSGTQYIYFDDGTSTPARNDSVSVKLVIWAGIVRVSGLYPQEPSGTLQIEPEHYWSILPYENRAKGIEYPYIALNINRMTGEIIVFSTSSASLSGTGSVYFSGKCSKSQKLF